MDKSGEEAEYLSNPYAAATLDEHRRMREGLIGLCPEGLLTRRYLNLPGEEQCCEWLVLEYYDLPQIHHALARCFPEWKQIGQFGCYGFPERTMAPTYRSVEVEPGQFREYLSNGVMAFRLPDGATRLLRIRCDRDSRVTRYIVCLLAAATQRELVHKEVEALRTWIEKNHYLKGKAIRADGTLLPCPAKLTWDAVALKTSSKQTIIQNTVGVIERAEQFKKLGIPLKRGVLLYGPPGTGKSLIGKILAASGTATLIYLTAADMGDAAAARSILRLARRLQPTIVFMEDLDLFAADRRCSRGGPLGELLAQMDGLENNDGLIFVATTNCPEVIEPAIKERPSRFDVVLEIGLPAKAERRRILEQNIGAASFSAALLNEAAEATAGLSGAQVREVAYIAMQEAIMRTPLETEVPLPPSEEDLHVAINRVTGNTRQPVGFVPTVRNSLNGNGITRELCLNGVGHD